MNFPIEPNQPNEPTEPVAPPNETPSHPDEDQELSPRIPDTEINPGKIGENTEVDLDTTKISPYEDDSPSPNHH